MNTLFSGSNERSLEKMAQPADFVAMTLLLVDVEWATAASEPPRTSSKLGFERNHYSSIRIHVDFGNASTSDNLLTARLHQVTREAVWRMANVLSVRSMDGPLLLKREACARRWSSGPNIYKCSSFRSNYRGEFCMDHLDNFKIPNEHLEGLDIFENIGDVTAKEYISHGKGVKKVDFILYVRAWPTELCYREELIAYATVCQLDENDRPMAGYVNVCPTLLTDEFYNFAKSVIIMMHELIHILGFSLTLFPKAKLANLFGNPNIGVVGGTTSCYVRKNPLKQDSDGHVLLILPTALKVVEGIVNCTDKCLELEQLQSDNSIGQGSHWQNLPFSIMAENVSKNRETYLDDLTLAVLQDSGWYDVNYSAARSFGDLNRMQEQPFSNRISCASSLNARLFLLISLVAYLEFL